VTSAQRASRRLTSVAVVIGLLGACAVLVVLVESPGQSSAIRGLGHPGRPQRSSSADMPQLGAGGLAPQAAQRSVTPASRAGLRLLSEAAVACQTVAFHGVQVSIWFGSVTESASVIQLWHRPDGQIVVQASPTGTSPAEPSQANTDQLGGQDNVLSVTSPLLALMRRNYVISYVGRSAVDGRPALLVAVRHPGGSLAARYWIDSATKLPLRRELFVDGSRILSEDAFLSFSVGSSQLRDMPPADARPWTGQLTLGGLASLAAHGWPLPGDTVGGLTLFESREAATKSGKIVELSYSDGLSVISVFVQHGVLPRSLPGWRRFSARDGSQVYAIDPDDRSLVWSAGGFVYTMISDAPPVVVDQAIVRLPHNSPVGFWARMGRGFRRLASMANPFR
jgi:sigma-E factor negative regulatory protein RseB